MTVNLCDQLLEIGRYALVSRGSLSQAGIGFTWADKYGVENAFEESRVRIARRRH